MITKLTHHDTHAVRVHLTRPGSKHYAALRCVDCNTHIQWLNEQDTKMITENFTSKRTDCNISIEVY
jgi:hypothetical protein